MKQPIIDTLKHIGGGVYIDDAADALAELVHAVDSTNKGGKLTLEISVRKATRGGAMVVTGKMKLSKPEEMPLETMMFATPEGNLVTSDPNQKSLDLKVVGQEGGAATPGQLKQVGDGTTGAAN